MGGKDSRYKESAGEACEEESEMTEFEKGMEVEKEHKDLIGNDKKKRAMIVNAHLAEGKNYYSLLEKMEKRLVK